MPVSDEDLAKPIVPGHPLYAQISGEKVISDMLNGWNIPDADKRANILVAALIRNNPSIFLCTADEMKE